MLPPGLRPASAVAALLAAVVLVVLGTRYAGDVSAGRLDGRLRDTVDQAPAGQGRFATLIHSTGDPLPVILTATVLAGAALVLGRTRLAVTAIAGPAAAGIATTVLKPAFGRTIEGGLAFPSGHTGAVTALGLVVALMLVSVLRARPSWGLLLLAAGAVLPAVAMAFALTALYIHYPTDTLGGCCAAVAAVLTMALAVDWMTERRRAG